jgi:hypothetical protein
VSGSIFPAAIAPVVPTTHQFQQEPIPQQVYTPYDPNQAPVPVAYGGQMFVPVYENPTEKNGLGTASLVLGILSMFCFAFLAGIPAIILGVQGRKAASQGLANNAGVATAGMVLGIIGVTLTTFIYILGFG